MVMVYGERLGNRETSLSRLAVNDTQAGAWQYQVVIFSTKPETV